MPYLYSAPEELMLAIVRPLEDQIPGLKVRTLIEDDTFTCPYVLLHSGTGAFLNDNFASTLGGGEGDIRFHRRFLADIQTWTDGADSEQKAWALHELIRLSLWNAFDNQTVYPGVGHLARFKTSSPAHKTPDWATATGVNQYANLPKGMVRYQAMYSVSMRPDLTTPISAADLVAFLSS
jgi:hypothetical protein